MPEPKYKVMKSSDGSTVYACSRCMTIYDGYTARQDAVNCYKRHTDVEAKRQAELSADFRNNPKYGKVLNTGDGYTRPDKYGRWRLGRTNEERRFIAYYQAAWELAKQEKKLSVEFYLDGGRYEHSGVYPKWSGKTAPLQRLAYGFHLHNWDMVKMAAYALAYDSEVRDRIKAWFKHLTDTEAAIAGYETELKNQAIRDGDLDHLYPDIDGMSLN